MDIGQKHGGRLPSEELDSSDLNSSSAATTSSTSMFFNKLNYDCRVSVYSFMSLPPFAIDDGRDWEGFVLSCKQAKQELESETAEALFICLNEVKAAMSQSTPGFIIGVPPKLFCRSFKELLNVRLTLPWDLFCFGLEDYNEADHAWSAASYEGTRVLSETFTDFLAPVLSLYLDKVTLSICGGSVPAYETGIERMRVARTVQRALKDIADMISRYNEFDFPWRKSDTTVRARCIVLAYNLGHAGETVLQDEAETSNGILAGFMYQNTDSSKKFFWGDRHGSSDRVDNDGWTHYRWPFRYRLHNQNRTAGEFGLVHDERWSLKTSGEVHGLFRDIETTPTREIGLKRCSSKGIDQDVVEGLVTDCDMTEDDWTDAVEDYKGNDMVYDIAGDDWESEDDGWATEDDWQFANELEAKFGTRHPFGVEPEIDEEDEILDGEMEQIPPEVPRLGSRFCALVEYEDEDGNEDEDDNDPRVFVGEFWGGVETHTDYPPSVDRSVSQSLVG